jgi:hypothetical protein
MIEWGCNLPPEMVLHSLTAMSLDLADPRHAQYVGWLLCAASVRTPGQEADTAIPCRRRPDRKPCRGHMRVMLTEVPELLYWRCTCCGDRGSIGPWRSNIWNLRDWLIEKIDVGCVELSLSTEEYRIVRESVCGPVVLIARAEPLPNGRVLLSGDLGDVDDLVAAIAEIPAPLLEGRRGRVLGSIAQRLEEAKREAMSPRSLDAREVAVALAHNDPPDERMRHLLRQLAGSLRVPFEARLGGTCVTIEEVLYVDADPPELRARTTLRGQPAELNLGAFQVELDAAVGALVALYRSWWIKQDRRRRRGG